MKKCIYAIMDSVAVVLSAASASCADGKDKPKKEAQTTTQRAQPAQSPKPITKPAPKPAPDKPKATRTVYMVEIDIRNSSFSLSIGKHIRNAFNAMQMEIPVDKEFYDSVRPGEEIASSFKTASFVMKGSLSSIKVTCVRKWTIKKPIKEKK